MDKRDPSLVKLGKCVFNEALWLVYLLDFVCLLCVEVRGQFLGSSFLLPPYRPQSSLRHQAWLQVSLPAEPSSQRQRLKDPRLLSSLLHRQGCPQPPAPQLSSAGSIGVCNYIELSPAVTQGGTKNFYCLRGRWRLAYKPFRNTAWRWQPGHTKDSATICHRHLLSACAVPQCEVTVTRQKLRGSQDPNEGLSFQAWSWDPQTGAWENQELPLTAGRETDMAREQPSQRSFLIRQPWQLRGRFGSGVRESIRSFLGMCSQDLSDPQEAAQHWEALWLG